MLKNLRNPILALSIAGYMSFLSFSPATASIVESTFSNKEIQIKNDRTAEIDKIQRALENEVVKEKLKAYGLTDEQIKERLKDMSDEQIHMLAQASDKILAGGDGIGFVIGVLVIILLIIVILKLLNKEIIIR